jgi:hypothetical protein
LKEDCQRWADDHRAELAALRLTRPKPLVDRNWRKWRSLLSIAYKASEACLKRAVVIAIQKSKGGDEELSIRLEILTRIRDVFRKQRTDFLPTTKILKYLNSDSEAPWADWATGTTKRLTAHRLGKELRYFPVRSRSEKPSGCHIRGYRLEDFKRYFDAFLLPENDLGSDSPPSNDSPPPEPQSPENRFVSSESAENGQVSGPGLALRINDLRKRDRLQSRKRGKTKRIESKAGSNPSSNQKTKG